MEAILLTCGIAGALLVAGILHRGGLLGGCLLVLLAGSCFGHAFYVYPLWPIPLTADRVLLAALVIGYVIYRRLGLTEPKPMQVVDWMLASFIGVVLLSTFTHDWSIRDNQPVSDVLFLFLMPLAVYWIARQSRVTRGQVLWLLGGLALFGIYLAVTAVAEVRGAWSFVFPAYIGSTKPYSEYFGRGRGPFLNPIANGVVLASALSTALLLWPGLSRLGRLAALLAVPVYLAGVLATLTRSVWMGAAAAALVVLGCTLPRRWRYGMVGATCLTLAIVAVAQWDRLWSFKRDRDVSAQDVADSAQLRPILAAVAWNMFKDRPLLGCGFGQYEQSMIYYLHDRSSGLPLEKARRYVQHNAFLGLLTEVGLVGAGLFAAVLTLWGRAAWRLWRAAGAPLWAQQTGLLLLALLATYLPNAMFHDVTLTPMVTMLLFTLAGATESLLAHADAWRSLRATHSRGTEKAEM
jgi:O-antigen ligase